MENTDRVDDYSALDGLPYIPPAPTPQHHHSQIAQHTAAQPAQSTSNSSGRSVNLARVGSLDPATVDANAAIVEAVAMRLDLVDLSRNRGMTSKVGGRSDSPSAHASSTSAPHPQASQSESAPQVEATDFTPPQRIGRPVTEKFYQMRLAAQQAYEARMRGTIVKLKYEDENI